MPFPRKPISEHKVQGTYRADRHGARAEPEAPGRLIDEAPPEDLTEEERTIWDATLRTLPSLRSADSNILALYCQSLGRYREALATQRAIDRAKGDGKLPLLLKGARGQDLVLSPVLREINRLALLVAKLGAELGLSPAARTRIDLAEAPQRTADDAEFCRLYGPPLRVIPGGRSGGPVTKTRAKRR